MFSTNNALDVVLLLSNTLTRQSLSAEVFGQGNQLPEGLTCPPNFIIPPFSQIPFLYPLAKVSRLSDVVFSALSEDIV